MGIQDYAIEQSERMAERALSTGLKLSGITVRKLCKSISKVSSEKYKLSGKIRLNNLLRQGKEIRVFSLDVKYFKKFSALAKKYGLVYTVVKEKGDNVCSVDILVKSEDKSKLNHIFMKIMSDYESELAGDKNKVRMQEKNNKEVIRLLDERKEAIENDEVSVRMISDPGSAQAEKSLPSENSYGQINRIFNDEEKPSVRAQLKQFEKEEREKAKEPIRVMRRSRKTNQKRKEKAVER